MIVPQVGGVLATWRQRCCCDSIARSCTYGNAAPVNLSDNPRTIPAAHAFSWRLRLALVVSVAIHALLLSIPLEGDVFGLPGLRMPWQERRLTATDLRIVLAPPPAAARPDTAVVVPAVISAVAPVSAPPAPASAPAVTAEKSFAVRQPRPLRDPAPDLRAPAPSPAAEQPDEAPRQQSDDIERARIIALENATRERLLRTESLRQEAVQREAAAQAQAQAQVEAQAQAQAQAQQLAAREAAARADAVQREAARVDQLRHEELARAEAARRDAEKLAEQRQQQHQQQLQLQQQQLQQQQQQQARLAQIEAERRAAIEQESARQLQLQAQARPVPSAQEAEREERLRAIGRQLNQEAAQRDAANGPSGAPLPTVSGLRRGWLMGRADPNADLVTYAQAMGSKIELNMTFDTVREAVKQPHRQPVVTVAVRRDGSVERVTFVTSSGVPAIDEAIRQIIASQAPYGPFPPGLARQYDVVEIRRTWIFDVAVRLE